MIHRFAYWLLAVSAVFLLALSVVSVTLAQAPPAKAPAVAANPPLPPPTEPAYRIILRSRNAVATPEYAKEGQTGGGFIQVTQLEPNVVMFLMRGATAAGLHCKGRAAMQFELTQHFEIVPTRACVLPPRLSMTDWLIGTLQSCNHGGGTAEQAAACATVESDGHTLLDLCLQPHGVAGGQKLFVNDREGPVEAPAAPCLYTLHQTFALSAFQPTTLCHAAAAVADFDPEAKLDAQWNEVLKPFRAVPHKDFGFRVILRVVEDKPLPGVVHGPAALPAPPLPAELLPPPTPTEKGEMPLPEPTDKP
ncbi:MAG TPA: hypothetical protein VH575_22590 [Gemmataceae bacterium]|jgi:hypothetical protein